MFSLPYAVIAVSVVTALFPRMSRSAALEHRGDVANTLAGGLTLSASLLVPATAALVAATVRPGSRLGRALSWGPLRWIGVRSYGFNYSPPIPDSGGRYSSNAPSSTVRRKPAANSPRTRPMNKGRAAR